MKQWQILSYVGTTNLGDAIQTMAISRLLPGDLFAFDRDRGNPNLHPDAQLIVNGFLRKKPAVMPTNALFTGIFCENPEAMQWPLQSDHTIGARDPYTLKLFQTAGKDVELCGCATMTFPRYSGPRSGSIAVDLPKQTADHHLSNYFTEKWDWPRQWAEASSILNALRSAELVYTIRLHVILPCLAFGTPIFMPSAARRRAPWPQRLSILDEIGVEMDKPFSMDMGPLAKRYKTFLNRMIGTDLANKEPVMP